MEWVQNYDPLGSATLSTLMAGLPIVVLLGLLVVGLGFCRVPGLPDGRLCGCQGGLPGGGRASGLLAAGAGAGGLEHVAVGGP